MGWKDKKNPPNTHVFQCVNEKSGLSATAKWDGCVELSVRHNNSDPNQDEGSEDVEHIHVCDLRKFIEDLEDLEKICKDNLDFDDWDY